MWQVKVIFFLIKISTISTLWELSYGNIIISVTPGIFPGISNTVEHFWNTLYYTKSRLTPKSVGDCITINKILFCNSSCLSKFLTSLRLSLNLSFRQFESVTPSLKCRDRSRCRRRRNCPSSRRTSWRRRARRGTCPSRETSRIWYENQWNGKGGGRVFCLLYRTCT